MSVDRQEFLRLHLNESAYPAPPGLVERALAAAGGRLNRYPEVDLNRLRTLYADYSNASAGLAGDGAVRPEQVVPTNGGDEAILNTVLTLRPQVRQIVVMPPTFSEYARAAGVAGLPVVEVPLTLDRRVDLERLEATVRAAPSLVFICDPNNPTANLLGAGEVLAALTRANPETFVAVDEAYWEFAAQDPSDRGRTLAGLMAGHPNLIILRTMSKAFSLAGARLGFIVAPTGLAKRLESIRMVFNINVVTLAVAEELLADPAYVRDVTARVIAGRRRLAQGLSKIRGVSPYPSWTNFVFARTSRPAADVVQGMQARGVLIRHYPKDEGLSHHIRVAVGTPDEIDRCLEALTATMEGGR
ncbi:MAG: histidinol-phosphate transaminase [Bacillota bacterium]